MYSDATRWGRRSERADGAVPLPVLRRGGPASVWRRTVSGCAEVVGVRCVAVHRNGGEHRMTVHSSWARPSGARSRPDLPASSARPPTGGPRTPRRWPLARASSSRTPARRRSCAGPRTPSASASRSPHRWPTPSVAISRPRSSQVSTCCSWTPATTSRDHRHPRRRGGRLRRQRHQRAPDAVGRRAGRGLRQGPVRHRSGQVLCVAQGRAAEQRRCATTTRGSPDCAATRPLARGHPGGVLGRQARQGEGLPDRTRGRRTTSTPTWRSTASC